MFVPRAVAALPALAEANRRELERRRRPWRDRFPAVLTGGNSVSGYSWTEQTFDSAGGRYTKPAGRTGSATYSPAFPYGDGTGPDSFPLEVQLRRTLVAGSLGPIYEFPYYCACPEFGSGSEEIGSEGESGESGPETVFVPCCPNPLPTTLFATITITAGTCACLPLSFALTYGGTISGGTIHVWRYQPDYTACTGVSPEPTVSVLCNINTGQWVLNIIGGENGLICQISFNQALPDLVCDPFFVSRSGLTSTDFGGCACGNFTFDITITE